MSTIPYGPNNEYQKNEKGSSLCLALGGSCCGMMKVYADVMMR